MSLFYFKKTFALLLPSTLFIIFPSSVQILLNSNLFLVSFNSFILIFVNLSVINKFFPFNLSLLLNIDLLSLSRTSLTIIDLFLTLFEIPNQTRIAIYLSFSIKRSSFCSKYFIIFSFLLRLVPNH